ncbi:MAG TPA: DsbA family protein [Caulobacteraceae bacterium]|nr:DsbA family protein [Caulobacteraceae bacterium]
MGPSTRRLFVIALAVLSIAGCNKLGGATPVTADDMSLGNASAKVTVIEYASATCPHCARFNNDVFPTFKAKYIDTGKIHYVFREFLTPPPEVAAAAFLTARCAGKDKYFSVLDAVFKGQTQMFYSGDVKGTLLGIAESAGLTEAQFNACINDNAALTALNNRIQTYIDKDGIDSTPTFVINGKKLVGEQTMASLDAAIAAAQTAS